MPVLDVAPPGAGVTPPIRTLISRLFVGYAVLSYLPNVSVIASQLAIAQLWWRLIVGAGSLLALGWAAWGAVRGRSIRPACLVYAGLTLVGVLSSHWAFSAFYQTPFLWMGTGTAVVATGLALGFRAAVGYSLVLALAWGIQRPLLTFGRSSLPVAWSEALFLVSASLSITALGLGMIAAARAADVLADQVYRRELTETVDRSLAQERARVDRVIHDEVMTSLVAVAHAGQGADPTEVRGAAELARSTLTTVDALRDQGLTDGTLSVDVVVRLLGETARRVSPDVQVVLDVDPLRRWAAVSSAVAEAVLGATREAIRNAVRHAGAGQITVTCGVESAGRLRVTVADDGVGFDPAAVGDERLGMALSISGRLSTVGATSSITSAAGVGTTVQMSAPLASAAAAEPVERGDDQLPAAFPARQLTVIMWAVLAVHLLLGLSSLSQARPDGPTLLAMPLMVATTYLVLHRGRQLRLPTGPTVAATLALIVGNGLVFAVLRRDGWPGFAIWQGYPTQLILVALVVRRRPWAALVALVAIAGVSAAWAVPSAVGVMGFVAAVFGHLLFFLLALAATRVLQSIAGRRQVLWEQERRSIEESVRRHVAVVQRSLWLDDLRVAVRPTLARAAALTTDVPAELAAECLLLEATLREGLLARNVMTEELAQLTDAARRRGVAVTFVDSRDTPVSDAVGKAVVAEVRSVLTSATVSRLVIRLGPDGRRELASVVVQDAGDTSMTVIDAVGSRTDAS